MEGKLRLSVVADPLKRVNTGDNTPAHIHIDIVAGDKVKITVAPKGFGSENMSRIAMLPPSAGENGVKDFVVETVEKAAMLYMLATASGKRINTITDENLWAIVERFALEDQCKKEFLDL